MIDIREVEAFACAEFARMGRERNRYGDVTQFTLWASVPPRVDYYDVGYFTVGPVLYQVGLFGRARSFDDGVTYSIGQVRHPLDCWNEWMHLTPRAIHECSSLRVHRGRHVGPFAIGFRCFGFDHPYAESDDAFRALLELERAGRWEPEGSLSAAAPSAPSGAGKAVPFHPDDHAERVKRTMALLSL